MPKIKKTNLRSSNISLLQRFQSQIQNDQSYLSLILGLLIVLIAGILVFNYFKKAPADLGPAEQTSEQADVQPEDLPGQYIVKEDDTLFTIAQKYYNDGYKFTSIAEENKLANADAIEVGQVLEIPKLEEDDGIIAAEATPTTLDNGTGGAVNQTIWGEKIEGNSYTVVEDDWLSKIAGRAYGDIMAFDKIATANNIPNPDLIEPGQVLQIPR